MPFLHSPSIWLLLPLIAVAVYLATRRRRSTGWGFKDVVKDPNYWKFTRSATAEVDAIAQQSDKWPEAKIEAQAKHFVFDVQSSNDSWAELRVLRSLGKRTHPIVLSLLQDTTLYARLVAPTGKAILDETPFDRACELLSDVPPESAVEAMSPFLDDPSPAIRKASALVIAKTGAQTILPLLRKAFSDENEYVSAYALMGLESALSGTRIEDKTREALFPEVKELLFRDRNSDTASRILFRLNPEKAIALYMSENTFTTGFPALHHILRVLAEAKATVPSEKLLPLISSLETKPLRYPTNYALGAALHLLGQQHQREDSNFLREQTYHSDTNVAMGASAGLLSIYGLEDYLQKIYTIAEHDENARLNQHQRLVVAVYDCHGEVQNGGFAQYFVNSSGNNWRDASAGFKAMGFTDRRSIFEEATSIFGSEGPSADRSNRQKELSKIFRRNDDIFEPLEKRYYASGETVESYITRFVLDHADSFR